MPESSTRKTTQVKLRCTHEEMACLASAAAALGVSHSQLVELGLLQALRDLGSIYFDDAAPALRPGYRWPWKPKRHKDESTKLRVAAYVPGPLFPAVRSAARAVRLSVPRFALGAALRQVALAKLVNERRRGTEPPKFNRTLAEVPVPYGFVELASTCDGWGTAAPMPAGGEGATGIGTTRRARAHLPGVVHVAAHAAQTTEDFGEELLQLARDLGSLNATMEGHDEKLLQLARDLGAHDGARAAVADPEARVGGGWACTVGGFRGAVLADLARTPTGPGRVMSRYEVAFRRAFRSVSAPEPIH